MLVNIDTQDFKACVCGNTPISYSIGYGSTPYVMRCKCGKQNNLSWCEITGHEDNLIDYWNTHLRHLTLAQAKQEVIDLNAERKMADPYNEYKLYSYFWVKDTGAVLSTQLR